MAFDKDRFSGLLALKLAEGATAFSPFAQSPSALPGETAAPSEVVVVDRPRYRWRIEFVRDDMGLIQFAEMSPVSRIVSDLPRE